MLSLIIPWGTNTETWPQPVSFTGSENVGRIVGKNVQSRFGKVLLELGGNNGSFPHLPSNMHACMHSYVIFIRSNQTFNLSPISGDDHA
jgi:hypothetical protein